MSVKPKARPVFTRFDKIDSEKPYKVTCPEMQLSPFRFKTLEMALDKVNEAKENRFQSILTIVDVEKQKLTFAGYTAPDWTRRRSV